MKQEEDPFWEPTEDVLIGSASVFLQVCQTLFLGERNSPKYSNRFPDWSVFSLLDLECLDVCPERRKHYTK